MSIPPASRSVPKPPLTLADVLAAVSSADLPVRRRQDLASAVRTVARAIGRPPEQVPADPRLLANRLAEVAPAALGFSKARWNNIRSLLRTALALVTAVAPGRHRTPLAEGWKTLWRRIESRSAKTRLSRFLHFCSAEGIEPEAVTEATLAGFRHHLELSLLKNPDVVFQDTVTAWSTVRTVVPGWPDLALARPSRRKTWTLPWALFPASLRADVQVWLDRLAGRDPLEELPFRPVKPGTLQCREYQIRQFASALVRRGRDPATLTCLAELVAIHAFKDGLRFFLDQRGGQSSSMVADIACTLNAVARHYVRVTPGQLEQMAAIIRRIDTRRRALTPMNRDRLRALDDPAGALSLVRLPGTLMDLARNERHPYRAARLAQTAVAIEILLMAPIRIGNLACLDIERHLVRPTRSGRALHIVIDGCEVKNREALDYPLPPSSIDLIESYLTEFRPTLTTNGTLALFPGRNGGHKAVNCLRQQISRAVHAHTGLRVHPHLFRHIAAKLFLDANPGGYEVIRRVLGHRSIETTTAFYTGLETAAAVRHFDEMILKLRHAGVPR